jgi:hypothetical protein
MLGWWLKRKHLDLLDQVSFMYFMNLLLVLVLIFSDDATLSDRRRLKEEYGIKTIIDLRTV